MTDTDQRPWVLRKRAACEKLGISSSTFDRLRAGGGFPAPIKLGAQAIAWRIDDLETWLEARETKGGAS